MSESLYAGEWFLPGNENRFQGRLLFNNTDKGIMLELFGKNYLDGGPVIIDSPNRNKRYHSGDYNRSYQFRHLLILGIANGFITLYNCEFNGIKRIGADLYIVKYKIEFVFFGAHINAVENLLIESATFVFPYLPSWYGADYAINKLDMVDNKLSTIPDFLVTLTLPISISIREGVAIVISDKINKNMIEVGVRHEWTYQMFAIWKYNEPVVFLDMLKDASIFGKLMELCLGKPLNKMLTAITLDKANATTDVNSLNNEKDIQLHVGNLSLLKDQDAQAHSMHQNHMLFSNWNMEVSELNSVIHKWYSNSYFFNIYDYYLDSNNWFQTSGVKISQVMFYNRFLNIVQGLEAYYMAAIGPKNNGRANVQQERDEFNLNKEEILKKLDKGSSLKEWFNSHCNYKSPRKKENLETKLKNLLVSMNPVLFAIFGQNEILDFFPRYASIVRNDLSHGKSDKIMQAKILHLFFHTGQLLLAICILETLEVKEIADKISRYDTFGRYIHQISSAKLNFV